MNKNQSVSIQEEVWYLFVNEQTRGPIGLRDLDVLIRTNQINSRTLGWRNGMNEWKPLNQIEEIKQSIFESSREMIEIQKKKQTFLAGGTVEQHNSQQENHQEQEEDEMVENKDEDPLAILEVTVENLLKKTFHQNQDGKWSIYDEQKAQWVLQDEEPTQKIALMKSNLLNKLKNELFFDHQNRRKNKHGEHQENLTKQQIEKRQKNRKKTKRMAEKKKQKWYNARINTFIYISGLPFDISEEQLKQFVCKAGVLRIDPKTGKQKLKLYKDENGLPKGDAAVSYAREESVQIALDMLNQRQIRQGFTIKIQRAQFNQKDQQYIPRQSKKQEKIKKLLAKKLQQKQLAWDENLEQKGDGFKIVIMKYIFTPAQMENPVEAQQIKKDIEDQVTKIGPIKRIRFFESHPDGVVQIKFQNDIDAQECISIMNGRFFDERSIVCEYWDGQTDFKRDANSIALQEQRLMLFANQLQEGDNVNGQNALKDQNGSNLDVIPQQHPENQESRVSLKQEKEEFLSDIKNADGAHQNSEQKKKNSQ